jgi:hypothetical protein
MNSLKILIFSLTASVIIILFQNFDYTNNSINSNHTINTLSRADLQSEHELVIKVSKPTNCRSSRAYYLTLINKYKTNILNSELPINQAKPSTTTSTIYQKEDQQLKSQSNNDQLLMAVDEFKESGIGYSLSAEHIPYTSQIQQGIDKEIAYIVQEFAQNHPIKEIKSDFKSKSNLWLNCKNSKPPEELLAQGTALYRSCQLMECL